MATIAVNLSVQVSGGPQIGIPPQKLEVEAYEKFEFSIGKDSKTNQDIPAPQPFDLGKDVSFLLIKSSLDEPPGADKAKLTYKFGAGQEVLLDKPHIYIGKGNVSVLGEDLTITLTFTPATPPATPPTTPAPPPTTPAPPPATPTLPLVTFVTVEILVGRDIA